MQLVRDSALCRTLLFCVVGFRAHVEAFRRPFRDPLPTAECARPRLRPWDGVHVAQVVKQYTGGRTTGVIRRIAQGTPVVVQTLRDQAQGGRQINAVCIGRLSATFRSRLAPLVRRRLALVQQQAALPASAACVALRVFLLALRINIGPLKNSDGSRFANCHAYSSGGGGLLEPGWWIFLTGTSSTARCGATGSPPRYLRNTTYGFVLPYLGLAAQILPGAGGEQVQTSLFCNLCGTPCEITS